MFWRNIHHKTRQNRVKLMCFGGISTIKRAKTNIFCIFVADYNYMQNSFEELCMNNIDKIKDALRVGGVLSKETTVSIKADDTGAGTQIDLVIIRNDNIVNLCEIKFTTSPYTIDSNYYDLLQRRIDRLRELIDDDNKSIHLTFITSKGVKQNRYSGIVQSEVLLDDLF